MCISTTYAHIYVYKQIDRYISKYEGGAGWVGWVGVGLLFAIQQNLGH